MGGVSAVHMMGQQAMGAGIRAGSATEDEGSCSQSSAQDQHPFDGRDCEAASTAEAGFPPGDGFETPRERGKMATEVPGQDSVGEGGSLCGSEGASGMGTGGYAHVRAPDHAPAGKRSPEEAMGAESDRSVRRRKFGVFLDHGVLESVRNGDTRLEVLGSKDKDSSSRAVDALLHLEGGHPMRSPASSDSGGSVGNGSASAGSGSPGTPASGTAGPSAGSPRAGTPPGNCLSPLLVKRKFASLPPTVNTVGEILLSGAWLMGCLACVGVSALCLSAISLSPLCTSGNPFSKSTSGIVTPIPCVNNEALNAWQAQATATVNP
jgi:hypothetical protein